MGTMRWVGPSRRQSPHTAQHTRPPTFSFETGDLGQAPAHPLVCCGLRSRTLQPSGPRILTELPAMAGVVGQATVVVSMSAANLK